MAYFRCTTGGSGKGNTLVVTCADDLAGATITCTNGTKTYTKTCPSTAPYEVTFYGLMAGTWTVSATVSGNTYTTTVVVADIEALLGGFNWRTWVDTAQFLDSSDYNSLSEVLADEEAVRELCLEHACVDYLASISTTNADVETIINTDLFAKWVNNSDYSLDTLGANTAIKALMDTADKYGYGEWVITDNTTTPPTWGAKGNVPVMTSDTAPYGNAFASSVYSSENAWKAFDNDYSTNWSANSTSASMGYKFTNPVCVKKVFMIVPNYNNTGLRGKDYTIQASNDNSNWETLYSGTIGQSSSDVRETISVDNDDYYLYYRVNFTTTYYSNVCLKTLQFYGRKLSVSVPEMTSNTVPYGTVRSTGNAEANGTYINGNNIGPTNQWVFFQRTYTDRNGARTCANCKPNDYIEYEFPYPVVIRGFTARNNYDGNDWWNNSFEIMASNDGTNFTSLGTFERASGANYQNVWYFDNDTPYKYYRYYNREGGTGHSTSSAPGSWANFFGVDYSEKEFEEGTNKKWLYDHGVELETITISGTGTKGTDAIQLTAANAQAVATIDTTDYSLMRGKVGSHASGTNQLLCGSGVSNFTASNMPNNNGLDVSSVNGSNAVGVKQTANGIFDATEFWLE